MAAAHQYVTGDHQTAARLQIQIKDGDYFRKHSDALYYGASFDLTQVTLRAQYNLRPPRTRAAYINACDTSFSYYYSQATNNSFREPQWQFAVKSADQRYFATWYNLPATSSSDPCALAFTPELIAAMQRLHPPGQTHDLRVRMKFGRVLSALWQRELAEYTDIYSPEFDLTPAPSGSYNLTRPATVDLTKILDQYLVTPQQHQFQTARQASEYIWGLVYKNPGNEKVHYAASFPNFQYDSVNFTRFLSTGGANNRLVMGQLYPKTSTQPAFPNGVPLLPANARPYLRLEARAKAKPYGKDLTQVFMFPHANRLPEFEYGYIDADGEFENISRCTIAPEECFTRTQDVFFAFRVKDPDLIHEVVAGFYRGSRNNVADRARIGPNSFTVNFTPQPARLTAFSQVTITTDYYLSNTFGYLTPRWNGLFFDIQVRDRLGGLHQHTYTLEVPDRPYGQLNMGYEASNTGRADVFADGSGVILVDHKYINFPGYARRQVDWFIGTTWITTSPVEPVTSRLELTPSLAVLAREANAPVRIKAVYQKGAIRQTITRTMPPLRVVLAGKIDGFYSGETPARVQAQIQEYWRNNIATSELFNNPRGDGQLESLNVDAKGAHVITPADWEPVYERHGRFPATTAWRQPPIYQARLRVRQATGGEALVESNRLTVMRPAPEAFQLELAYHDRDENGRATPGEFMGFNLHHRPAEDYLRGEHYWEFSTRENFAVTLTAIARSAGGVRGRYTLGAWPIPAPYLRAKFVGQDKFGHQHTLTTDALTLGERPPTAATLKLQSAVFTASSVLTLDVAGVRAPDGGRFVSYAWQIGPPVVVPGVALAQTPAGQTYTLTQNDFNRLNLGYEVRATAIYLDKYTQRTTVTAGLTFSELVTLGAAPTEISFDLQPPARGAPGELYSITLQQLMDANGIGTVSYQWQTRRGATGAYHTLALTTAIYPLAAEDFPPGEGAPEVRVALTHHDATGVATTFYSTAPVPLHPVTGGATLTTSGGTIGSTIYLVRQPTDANGIKTLNYFWGTDQGGLISTAAFYQLQPRDLNPVKALALTVRVEDAFGYRTTLIPAPLTLAQPSTGELTIYLRNGQLTLDAVLALLTTQIQDPNGGRVTNFQWRGAAVASTRPEITLTAPIITALRAGQTLEVRAEHRDDFGFSTRLTANFAWDGTNVLQQNVQGTISITGPKSFTPALTLTAQIDDLTVPQGIYQINYFWRVKYPKQPETPFIAGTSVWVQSPADWPLSPPAPASGAQSSRLR